ncbi:MAG: hypothetical protein KJ879_03600 [Nanoarchaeota archaeon]|nr:hypothetical protein [Nanoarchaeota archaeon]
MAKWEYFATGIIMILLPVWYFFLFSLIVNGFAGNLSLFSTYLSTPYILLTSFFILTGVLNIFLGTRNVDNEYSRHSMNINYFLLIISIFSWVLLFFVPIVIIVAVLIVLAAMSLFYAIKGLRKLKA